MKLISIKMHPSVIMLLFLLTTLLVIGNHDAAAHLAPSRVDENEPLRLRGGAIVDESSGQFVFLVCSDEQSDCQNVQYVIKNNDGHFYWLTPEFKLENEAAFSRHIRSVDRAITSGSNLHEQYMRRRRVPLFANHPSLSVLVTTAMVDTVKNWTSSSISILSSLNSQDGFNWSERTKTVSEKKFRRLKALLTIVNKDNLNHNDYRSISKDLLFGLFTKHELYFQDGNWYDRPKR